MTPLLPEILAQIMDMPKDRVAVRRPDTIEDVQGVSADFCTPDAVTPLGILKLAGAETLNFLNVTLNGQPLRLFNLGGLTIGDALLAAGIDARSLSGRPGLGITLNINGERKFLAGSHGQSGQLTVNGKPTLFSDSVSEGDVILVEKGSDGCSPNPCLAELVELPAPHTSRTKAANRLPTRHTRSPVCLVRSNRNSAVNIGLIFRKIAVT